MKQHWKEFEKGYLTNVLTNRAYRDYTNIVKTEGEINRYVYKNVRETDLDELERLHPTEEVLISLYLGGGIKIVPTIVEFLIEGITKKYYEEEEK